MTFDALVVGGGPAGCAAAIVMARSGHRVALIERSARDLRHPWAALATGAALRQFRLLDVEPTGHHISQLRVSTHSTSLLRSLNDETLTVIRRPEVDHQLLAIAEDLGVHVLLGHEATRPTIERGFLRGAAVVHDGSERHLSAEYVVIADGANSTFGRALGTHRRRDLPYLTCASATWDTPLSRVVECEVIVGLRRADDEVMPGHGWVAPDGHGSATITVVIPSTARDASAVNPLAVLDATARSVAQRWSLDPDRPSVEPRTLRLPVGRSVSPIVGPTFVVVGDAAATTDPFSALGLGPALASGTMAGERVSSAIATGASAPLQSYPDDLAQLMGSNHRRAAVALQITGREIGHAATVAALKLIAAASRSR